MNLGPNDYKSFALTTALMDHTAGIIINKGFSFLNIFIQFEPYNLDMSKKKTLTLLLSLIAVAASSCGVKTKPSSSEDDISSDIDSSISSSSSSSISSGEESSQSEGHPTEEAYQYDFSNRCYEHLTYIGNNLKDRSITSSRSNDHDAAKEYIKKTLMDKGYTSVREQPFNYSSYSPANVICSIEGKSSDKKIVIGAHYDGDGVGDNGSGIALLLGVAEGLYNITPKYDTDIVFFDCEEVGEYGSDAYVDSLTNEEISNIEFMVNVDSIAFGDYPNIYGGKQSGSKITQLEGYELAVSKAKELGFKMWDTEDLDGYYKNHSSKGPEIEDYALYTNPWTKKNDAPKNGGTYSPTTIDASDHVPFKNKNVPIIYFEATNWFAKGDNGYNAYTGYFETIDTSIGYYGMFMNTEYDTLENLEEYFPGRAEAHLMMYSALLSSLMLK